ncbi:MAG: hypothetical protein PF518_18585 [Spirochaetaceae bacterium]|jgi:phosphotransferase system HPr-like phosphotransfer protein|nr:hypothetical protein [Spirochaetaceae bacterium]
MLLNKVLELDEESFGLFISNEMSDLLSLSYLLSEQTSIDNIQRPIIGKLHLEATRCEEIMDYYGSKQNKDWFPFRQTIAVTKSFTAIAYNLLHIKKTAPLYNLKEVDGDFLSETENVTKIIIKSLILNASTMIKIIEKKKIKVENRGYLIENFTELFPEGILPNNRKRRKTRFPSRVAINLATSFLNLAEESKTLKIYKKVSHRDYRGCIPEIISEEQMRILENKFHNLQSIYDTHLQLSDIAQHDKNLPILRGQVSLVYHLLETATVLVHYIERHANYFTRKWKYRRHIEEAMCLSVLMDYFISYCDKFIVSSQEVCRTVLRQYSVFGSITVSIPNYRGFHVRPSTLLSKIVIHYGGNVKMTLHDQIYDASMPLELFRANELINSEKRIYAGQEIMKHHLIKKLKINKVGPDEMRKKLRIIFLDLLEQKTILIYENSFSFEGLDPVDDENLIDYVKRAITTYLALGKIDIASNMTVTFTGDRRVLKDIQILAENGYGEDLFGNNIVLPSELSYLRR